MSTESTFLLRKFGYDFDTDGKLQQFDITSGLTNKGFEFRISSNPEHNQKRYEELGEIITRYVYDLLELEGLEKLPVPKKSHNSLEFRSFIFANKDNHENDKLIILIHGSGVVRAGQWARRLIINDNLYSGTQIPYIRKAKELGYNILVLNTNDNERIAAGKTHKILGSEDPHKHIEAVWNDYIRNCKAKHIAIIAHSYGGQCIVQFAAKHAEEFKHKVFAVALTDSFLTIPQEAADIIKPTRVLVCINFYNIQLHTNCTPQYLLVLKQFLYEAGIHL
ncbi:PREDICTED: UPF0528 protein CG10038 isoform X1 [Wasmannia auropunctata]|uniref:UPF0528 protein CG10038 isoform X1 n=1 Tax=Wasmannia auropunctata TaxID=64793 RepID=UPI0005F093B4|nr:PREDICTED: UPF0528 protein CG10038 isoform X1 [Wasmannia auropunctata]XP_011688001.1 PREDICTED: UPF0528 protein CG10038 isoform X1 [Wasmannia auropunctata]